MGLSILGLFVVGFLAYLGLRNRLLNSAWEKAVVKFEKKGYRLACADKGFAGLFGLDFKNISLSKQKDTLFQSQNIHVEIAVWTTLLNGPALSALQMDETRLKLVKKPDYCNFCGLQNSGEKNDKSEKKEPLVQRAFDLLKNAVSRTPDELKLNHFVATFEDSSELNGLEIPSLLYEGKNIDGVFKVLENQTSTDFIVKGTFSRRKMTGKLTVTPKSKSWVEIPGLKKRFHTSAGFALAEFELEELDMNDGVLHLVADGHFSGVMIDDRRIADTNVVIQDCKGKLVANVGTDFFEIDSATSLSLNKIETYLYARADLGTEKAYTLKFKAKRIKANDFFQSLPSGMFSHLKGIKAEGELEYKFYAHIEDKNPYDAILESELKPYNFKITQMGETDLRKMNGSFVHTFYEGGKPVRSFTVGPSNPAFTPLDQIPEMLRNAVMTGEDPAFYGHNGFYLDAFRSSLAQNYVRGKFSRGGSTISMQLVKNVFLSRRKTIARKAEEILIVWLIENQHLTGKARMFEVYLNVIEWGPNVFGVGEAAPFYFSKSAQQLEPLECAFLASIVPSPKKYRYFLDSAGNVSERNWNFVAIRNRMIQKGMLNASDSASFNVKITGPAANYLKKNEPEIPLDEEEDELVMPIEMVNSSKRKF